MKLFRYKINGEVKECYAPNLLKAMVLITKSHPEIKKESYTELNVTEIK